MLSLMQCLERSGHRSPLSPPRLRRSKQRSQRVVHPGELQEPLGAGEELPDGLHVPMVEEQRSGHRFPQLPHRLPRQLGLRREEHELLRHLLDPLRGTQPLRELPRAIGRPLEQPLALPEPSHGAHPPRDGHQEPRRLPGRPLLVEGHPVGAGGAPPHGSRARVDALQRRELGRLPGEARAALPHRRPPLQQRRGGCSSRLNPRGQVPHPINAVHALVLERRRQQADVLHLRAVHLGGHEDARVAGLDLT
mmetsp:Transcript_13900/g.44059  ORF Transcript_13900/g.44059 Transcript_13900/m.44059 type:complete len:250 (-) Transcript_13900:1560-2309(-)